MDYPVVKRINISGSDSNNYLYGVEQQGNRDAFLLWNFIYQNLFSNGIKTYSYSDNDINVKEIAVNNTDWQEKYIDQLSENQKEIKEQIRQAKTDIENTIKSNIEEVRHLDSQRADDMREIRDGIRSMKKWVLGLVISVIALVVSTIALNASLFFKYLDFFKDILKTIP